MQHYRFVNPEMTEDIIDPKTKKVLVHKEINVCSDSEDNARIKAYRPKVDIDSDRLSSKWELVGTFQLNKLWDQS